MIRKTLDFEIAFFEPLVHANPNHIEALVALAQAYTRKGLHEKGLELDERLAGILEDDPIIHYNLACSYALVGEKDLAFQTLTRAIKLGYSDFDHLKKDSDLKSLHNDPRFLKILSARSISL